MNIKTYIAFSRKECMRIDKLARKNTRIKSARSKSGRGKLTRKNFDDLIALKITRSEKSSDFKNS